MKRIRLVGCLAVALTLSGILTTSALARQHHHGNRGNAYSKWLSGVSVLELGKAAKLECKTSKGGEPYGIEFDVFGPTTALVTVVFEGCEMAAKKCRRNGEGDAPPAPEGMIFANLGMETGYINKANGEAGLDLFPLYHPADDLYNFECPGSPDIYVRVKGSVIGRIEPVNVMTTQSKVVLNASAGAQEVERFESGEPHTLLAEVSFTGATGKFETLSSAQALAAALENLPQGTFADPTELKTGGAVPEFGRCRPTGRKGKYTDANCDTLAQGKVKGKFGFFPVHSK